MKTQILTLLVSHSGFQDMLEWVTYGSTSIHIAKPNPIWSELGCRIEGIQKTLCFFFSIKLA
jgi:hypothetical protein